MTIRTEPSLAMRMAATCDDRHLYVTGNVDPNDPTRRFVRIFGLSRVGDHGVTGLWHLLNDEELGQLGIEAHKFKGGGLILPDGHPRYYTTYALARCVWRLLGKPDAEPIFL